MIRLYFEIFIKKTWFSKISTWICCLVWCWILSRNEISTESFVWGFNWLTFLIYFSWKVWIFSNPVKTYKKQSSNWSFGAKWNEKNGAIWNTQYWLLVTSRFFNFYVTAGRCLSICLFSLDHILFEKIKLLFLFLFQNFNVRNIINRIVLIWKTPKNKDMHFMSIRVVKFQKHWIQFDAQTD